MGERKSSKREPKGIPWNERVVIEDFDRDAQVTLAFPGGPTVTAFLPGIACRRASDVDTLGSRVAHGGAVPCPRGRMAVRW